ncbi:MAG: biotin transporter BioY [bacterium]
MFKKIVYKQLFKKIRYLRFLDNYPKFNPGSLLVAVLCVFLIIISTFTQLPLGLLTIPEEAFLHPIDFFSNIKSANEIMKVCYYIPQIPSILFIGALLGPRIGLIAIFIYIVLGLAGLPIFASGGGINYYSQLGFGYILGYLASVYLVGNILSAKINTYSIFRATIVGVFSIHLVGIVYLICLMLLQQSSILLILGWIWAQSGIQLPYDLFIGFIAISLARSARSIFWMAMD